MAQSITNFNLLRIGKVSLIVAAVLTATAYVALKTVNRRTQRTVDGLLAERSQKQNIGFGTGL